VEYSPSCIACRHSGIQLPSFHGTRPIINGSHQLTTEPFPNQINPVCTSHPRFVRFISVSLIYPPIFAMVVKMFSFISNPMPTKSAKPFRLHGFTSLLKGAQFLVARSPWRPILLPPLSLSLGGVLHWRVLSVEFLSCRPSGAWNFEVAYEFFFGTFVYPWAVTIFYLSLYLLCPLY